MVIRYFGSIIVTVMGHIVILILMAVGIFQISKTQLEFHVSRF